MDFKNKTILITGASGLVGYPTVVKCLEEGASQVIAVDIKISDDLIQFQKQHPTLSIRQLDLTYLENCEMLFTTKVDICLHLAGIKGSPTRATKQPADYLFPMLMFNTNMIKAAFDAKVNWFVYTLNYYSFNFILIFFKYQICMVILVGVHFIQLATYLLIRYNK